VTERTGAPPLSPGRHEVPGGGRLEDEQEVDMSMARTHPVAAGIALFTLAALAGPPAAGAATCRQWDISGHWEVTQTGEGIVDVKFDLTQEESRVGGTAYFCERCGQVGPAERFAADYEGTVEGTVIGGKVTLTIDWWGDDRLGEYTAFIGPMGDLHSGQTRDLKNPLYTANWWVDRKAQCKSNRPPAAEQPLGNGDQKTYVDPKPTVVKKFGRKTVGATTTVNATLYNGPSVDSGVVGTLPAGVESRVLEQQGDWYKLDVTTLGIAAWAQKEQLSFRYLP
jgi:hypothetical protein